jgi:hypothetical protein
MGLLERIFSYIQYSVLDHVGFMCAVESELWTEDNSNRYVKKRSGDRIYLSYITEVAKVERINHLILHRYVS